MGSSQAKAESLAECNAVDFTSQVTTVRSYSGFSLPQNVPPFCINILVVHGRHTGSVSPKIFEDGVPVGRFQAVRMLFEEKHLQPNYTSFLGPKKGFQIFV